MRRLTAAPRAARDRVLVIFGPIRLPPPKVRGVSMFDIDRFAADCRAALAERGSDAIREVVRRAVSEPGGVIAALGEKTGAFADVLVRAPDLTILNVVWGARQWTLPH